VGTFATNSTLVEENQPRHRLFQFRYNFVLTVSGGGGTRMIVSYLELDMLHEMEDEAGCREPSGGRRDTVPVAIS
jgi:hypothetical protein